MNIQYYADDGTIKNLGDDELQHYKYIKKIRSGNGWRYFYTPEELKSYYDQGKKKASGLKNEIKGNYGKLKSDTIKTTNIAKKSLKKTYNNTKKDVSDFKKDVNQNYNKLKKDTNKTKKAVDKTINQVKKESEKKINKGRSSVAKKLDKLSKKIEPKTNTKPTYQNQAKKKKKKSGSIPQNAIHPVSSNKRPNRPRPRKVYK